MPDPLFNEIDTITVKEIWPAAVYDQLFVDDPFLAYLRDHALEEWAGGTIMQQVHLVKPLIGGPYSIGQSFDISMRDILAPTVFQPRRYEVNVTEALETIRSVNRGPRAAFSIISIKLKAAISTLNAILSIALSHHGQASGTGVSDDRSVHMNGWAEAISDGVSNSWDGNTFPTYGGATRGGFVGTTMNSVPRYLGDSAGNLGEISYFEMEQAYQDASKGPEMPDLFVSSRAGVTAIKTKMQAQQRFTEGVDAVWGVNVPRFGNASVLVSDYWPSARYGKNDPDLGDYTVPNFTSGAAPDAQSGLPASTTIQVGEIAVFFNTKYWHLRISTDDLFNGGFTGWKPAQDNTIVAGQTLIELNAYCLSPRFQKLLFGFNR